MADLISTATAWLDRRRFLDKAQNSPGYVSDEVKIVAGLVDLAADLRRQIEDTRALALEEAAKIADSHFLAMFIDGQRASEKQARINGGNAMARRIAVSIRSLGQESKGERE